MNKETGVDGHSEHMSQINSFSYIRAVSCIAIIVLHTSYAAIVVYGGELGKFSYIASRVAEYGMMWAVPCFVMVTGALLLDVDRKIPLKKLFQKYIVRIFAALAIFTLILRIVDMFLDGEPFGGYIFIEGFSEMFTGTSWAYLWYLYLLLGLYFLMPFYKKIVQYSTDTELKYLLGIYVIFLSALPILQIWNINCGFYIHVSTIYPFFLFCGYVIYKEIWQIKLWCAVLMTVAATGAMTIITIVRWSRNIQGLDVLLGYSSIFVIMQAVGIFTVIIKIKVSGLAWLKKLLMKIDECSFGIYLIHMIFIKVLLNYVGFNPYKTGGFAAFCGMIAGITAVSYWAVWILKKIPVFRSIF